MTEQCPLRKSKPDDQEKATLIFSIIDEAIREINKKGMEIDPNQIVAGLLSLVANSYEKSGVSYENYKQEMQKAIKFYKRYWK